MVVFGKKKAIFYMLMSVTIMGIIVASVLVFSNRFKHIERSSIETISEEFISTTISDMSLGGLDRFMEVASKRALQELALYTSGGRDLDNFSQAFDELVLNGTINSTIYYFSPTIGRFLGGTANYYFVLGFKISKITIDSEISQIDPWNLNIKSDISYKVNVPRTKFTGIIETTKETNVSIFGLPDPKDGWTITTHWGTNSTYPSFLDMIEGNSAGSSNGICREC